MREVKAMHIQETHAKPVARDPYRTARRLIGSVGYGAALRYCYAEQWLGVADAVCTIRRRQRCQ